jgi:pyruvate, water dikinase
MSTRLRRLMPLRPAPGRTQPGHVPGSGRRGNPADTSAIAGAKAARLSAALRAGLPVLPGWVVPAAESRAAVQAAAATMRRGQFAAARRAVLSRPLDGGLAAELAEAAACLGGDVIVRSSSKLEGDPRWSGAFASVAGVRPDEVANALRSCWASAFAVDPLARLDACGLQVEDLELAALIQPEIHPAAGGVARVTLPVPTEDSGAAANPASADRCVDIAVEGVEGHPGALLQGWSDGASALVTMLCPSDRGIGENTPWQQRMMADLRNGDARAVAEGPLLGLVGCDVVLEVARLAEGVHRLLGDDTIEWAVHHGRVWLLQCRHAGRPPAAAPHTTGAPHTTTAPHTTALPGPHLADRELMPMLGAAIRARGHHLHGRPTVAGEAAGRLVACRSHERPPAACRDAILLIDRPVPAFAPLLFTARGVIARSGTASSHLAEVARSLTVPMVTGCRPEAVTGAYPTCSGWLAVIDGSTGDVVLSCGDGSDRDRREARHG